VKEQAPGADAAEASVRRLLTSQLLAASAVALGVLSVVATGLAGWMLMFSVPHYERIFMDMGSELPPLTRLVIDVAHVFGRLPFLIPLLLAPSAGAILLGLRWRSRGASVASLAISAMVIVALVVIWIATQLPLMSIIDTVGRRSY
jgi:hypothetical protein